jgi:hypothetical protein
MTPEQYAEHRLQILEQVTRDLMRVILISNPMVDGYVNKVGQEWDKALDRLDDERAQQNALPNAEKGQPNA